MCCHQRHVGRPGVGGKTKVIEQRSIFEARSMPTKHDSCSMSSAVHSLWPLRQPSTDKHGAAAFTQRFSRFCLNVAAADGMPLALVASDRMSSGLIDTFQFGLAFAQV